MTLEDILKLPLTQTAAVAAAGKDIETKKYITICLADFYAGKYGEIPEEDTAANNADLEAGEGRIIARYKKAEKLENDIYIISDFYAADPDNIEANHTTILYCNEY